MRRRFAIGFLLALVACAVGGPPVVAPTVVLVGGVDGGAASAAPPTSDDVRFRARDEVEVEWRSSWWPAVVLEARGRGWLVHYDGYGSEWDEVVGPERIRARKSEPDDDEPDEPDDEPTP